MGLYIAAFFEIGFESTENKVRPAESNIITL